MIGPVLLGGKWWAHNGDCAEVQFGPHIHYGQNVILGLDQTAIPKDVLDEYYVLFGNPDASPPEGILGAADAVIETTDAPGYTTQAITPKKQAGR